MKCAVLCEGIYIANAGSILVFTQPNLDLYVRDRNLPKGVRSRLEVIWRLSRQPRSKGDPFGYGEWENRVNVWLSSSGHQDSRLLCGRMWISPQHHTHFQQANPFRCGSAVSWSLSIKTMCLCGVAVCANVCECKRYPFLHKLLPLAIAYTSLEGQGW